MNTLHSVGMQPGLGGGLESALQAAEMGAQFGVAMIVLAFVALGYVVITLDRRREGAPSRDDTQVGIKLVLWGVLALAVIVTAMGVTNLLAFILGGFKGGWAAMRGSIAVVLSGGGVAAGIWLALLPRTNNAEQPQVERFGVGLIAAVEASVAIMALQQFLTALLAGAGWPQISSGLAAVGVAGGLGVLALARLGGMSGWRAAPPRMPQMPMAPPMGGQQMPPQGGMPPLGGGYPPQGGAPPQGGGYPPQGGGWPQGGGQPPPQGGGGWPPQGGGWPGQ